MLENSNSDRMENNMRRRAVLKSVGAASTLGIGTQTVAAWGGTELSQNDLEAAQELLNSVEVIDRPHNRSFLRRGRNSDEFRTLFSAIKADHGNIRIADRTAYRVDKLGVYIAQFHVTVSENEHDGEIIIPIESPRLSPDEQHNDVDLDPGAVITGYSDDVPVEINRYMTGDQTEFSTSGHAGISKRSVAENINRVTIDLITAEDEVQIQSDATCEQCKLALGALNAGSCGMGSYLTCSVVTAQTVVGPIACAAIVPTVCFIIQNYATNDPDKTCAGEDMWGNKVVPEDLDTFC